MANHDRTVDPKNTAQGAHEETPSGKRVYGAPTLVKYGTVTSITGSKSATSIKDTKGGGQTANNMLSDRRLKSGIVKVGVTAHALNVYEYRIFGRRERGVMADEVELVMPAAVSTRPDGYKQVDYGMLGIPYPERISSCPDALS